MRNLAETALLFGGIYNPGFAVFHLAFWRIFRWKEDLASLTRINWAIMQVLYLRLTFVFLVIAYHASRPSPSRRRRARRDPAVQHGEVQPCVSVFPERSSESKRTRWG